MQSLHADCRGGLLRVPLRHSGSLALRFRLLHRRSCGRSRGERLDECVERIRSEQRRGGQEEDDAGAYPQSTLEQQRCDALAENLASEHRVLVRDWNKQIRRQRA